MLNNSIKKIVFTALLLLVAAAGLPAQAPSRPTPPRLVNDLAGLFTPPQTMQLEQRLVAFNDSTSNQVVVITVNDLGGYEASQFAYAVGEQWGVGQGKFNNGVVILIKPKTGTGYGEAFIATGYGVEGILPDAVCRSIVNNEMIPYFRQNDYFRGVEAALAVTLPLLAGEYSYEQYGGASNGTGLWLFIGFVALAVILALIVKGGKGGGSTGGSAKSSFWTALWVASMTSGRKNSSGGSSWGGHSSGGFGGFGGGHFGGGGGGGRW
jgi:uncharacterized protein